MSRLASGSSSSNNFGREMSAWAIMIRCCSPPDRFPIRASANRVAPTASSISSTAIAALRRRLGDPEAVPVESEPDQVPGPQRHVRLESDLLGTYPICGLCRDRVPPVTMTRPSLGAIRPRIARNSVVFPAPFEPMSPQNPPASTENDTRSSTRRPPSDTLRSSTRSTIIGAHRRCRLSTDARLCRCCRQEVVAHRHRCWVEAPVVIAFLIALSSAIIHDW